MKRVNSGKKLKWMSRKNGLNEGNGRNKGNKWCIIRLQKWPIGGKDARAEHVGITRHNAATILTWQADARHAHTSQAVINWLQKSRKSYRFAHRRVRSHIPWQIGKTKALQSIFLDTPNQFRIRITYIGLYIDITSPFSSPQPKITPFLNLSSQKSTFLHYSHTFSQLTKQFPNISNLTLSSQPNFTPKRSQAIDCSMGERLSLDVTERWWHACLNDVESKHLYYIWNIR